MNSGPATKSGGASSIVRPLAQGGLFWKYAAMFAAVLGIALVGNGLVNIWFMYDENRVNLYRLQMEQAAAAAEKISQFVREIENQMEWTTHLSWAITAMDQRELDARRLLRQVPAITELRLLDPQGRERLHLSRQAEDNPGSNADHSSEEMFKVALADGVYYGPVYFRRQTEPYMTLAVGGARRDAGVSVAEVNLKHIWDVVSQIHVGRAGKAYVVGAQGHLIAHPDISHVLRNMDLSHLPQVAAARSASTTPERSSLPALDLDGKPVLTTFAVVKPLDWLVFIELPEQEASAPLYAALARSLALTVAGLALAFVAALLLARHMVVPIRSLAAGAQQIGVGALDHRIEIKTRDELGALAHQFNSMASRLQGSYEGLERKVDERTRKLQEANMAKSRFLAVASHDLRQPLHALNLLVAQLSSTPDRAERERLTRNIASCVDSMNRLFNELLDISRLDAGALTPRIAAFPVEDVLSRTEATFSATAREKGLHFRVVKSSAWVASDSILLGRILLNLVSNAVRYTSVGGVVVGCRHAGGALRIDVCDTGAGIAEDQQRAIFGEFYRIQHDGHDVGEGLGLGLAIVERLCSLLDHPLTLTSIRGRGSRFSISLPMAPAGACVVRSEPALTQADLLRGKLVVVIDDDPLVREGTQGLLMSWGCRVVVADSSSGASLRLNGTAPDLIISDLHLAGGGTGIAAIDDLRRKFGTSVPAFLITGDISVGQTGKIGPHGHALLHKPISPMVLRAMMMATLHRSDAA
ncbi:hybrid sensor histidine kinase/response regulator [Xanthobacter autotrophicus]|uniref:hybrid sensor histidine kinase/response regulator n=1 Tax=Xanthobacter autotrophicus TaxID=280 RepID=UPI0024A71484|nr:ATP-binding protein [Xanthobacter autotrophicus]MDI4657644.1 HAMP domain-containing protein [Xanthobacter autotrophicus]